MTMPTGRKYQSHHGSFAFEQPLEEQYEPREEQIKTRSRE